MKSGVSPIKNFVDLYVWQMAHELVLCIYTKSLQFPKEELFGLTSQIRRASISTTSNIAEGFGRFSYKEKIQFYLIARGSLVEVQNQLLVARDVHYLSQEDFSIIYSKSISILKMLNGLIQASRSKLSQYPVSSL